MHWNPIRRIKEIHSALRYPSEEEIRRVAMALKARHSLGKGKLPSNPAAMRAFAEDMIDEIFKGKDLREKIFDTIISQWPVNVRGVIKKMGMDEMNISNVTKFKYHFDQLARDGRIRVKRIDRALVAWPADIEKLRIVHEFMRGI